MWETWNSLYVFGQIPILSEWRVWGFFNFISCCFEKRKLPFWCPVLTVVSVNRECCHIELGICKEFSLHAFKSMSLKQNGDSCLSESSARKESLLEHMKACWPHWSYFRYPLQGSRTGRNNLKCYNKRNHKIYSLFSLGGKLEERSKQIYTCIVLYIDI